MLRVTAEHIRIHTIWVPKKTQTPTCCVASGQENLDEVSDDQHLRGVAHVWLDVAQNLHTGLTDQH